MKAHIQEHTEESTQKGETLRENTKENTLSKHMGAQICDRDKQKSTLVPAGRSRTHRDIMHVHLAEELFWKSCTRGSNKRF